MKFLREFFDEALRVVSLFFLSCVVGAGLAAGALALAGVVARFSR